MTELFTPAPNPLDEFYSNLDEDPINEVWTNCTDFLNYYGEILPKDVYI